MAPEEKAYQLIKKSNAILGYYAYHSSKETTDMSIFCVDEIISLLGTMQQGNLILSYWLDVKQELETL